MDSNTAKQHPSDRELESLVRGTSLALDPQRNAQIVLHLLQGCSRCKERANTLLSAARDGDYGSAFAKAERTLSTFLDAGAPPLTRAAALLSELTSFPEAEQLRRANAERRYSSPTLVNLLLDQSHAARYQDTRQMLHLANLASLLAEACSSEEAGDEQTLADLRGRAQGHLANSLRVCGYLPEAEEAIAVAQRSLQAGSGDPPLRARLLEQTSSLRMLQGRFAEAIDLAEEASAIYREIGQQHSHAGALVHMAIAHYYASEPEEAIVFLNRAIPLIDLEHNPQLLLAACHNLILSYLAAGRPEHALSLYFEARDLYREFDDELILLRAGWQEGQLLRDLDHLQAAEAALLQARKGFLERNLAHEVAFVSLDLACVYVKLGKLEEVKQTVHEAIPIFRALRVGKETLAALLQLQQAAGQEQRALELIRALNSRLSSPSLR